MAVNPMLEKQDISIESWYERYEVDERKGCVQHFRTSQFADALRHRYQRCKSEMDLRVANYDVLEKIADGTVIREKPDLPNVSSGDTAGLVRRTARNVVQNVPNVEVISTFNDDSLEGVFAKHILTAKIIGSDEYANDMQQNLFASTKKALALGFQCVIPVLLQDAGGSWYMKYDTIHYRDVFPEHGAKDVRQATEVFVRRYLTKGEAVQLVRDNAPGWDHNALRKLLEQRPPAREQQSVDHQTKKHHQTPEGYECITWYNSLGDPFITFDPRDGMLLRIEKNKHPLKQHPVFFLVMEKDEDQPLGKSQVDLLIGRQDFQDLMLNGAMKMWYRNINPPLFGFGAPNAMPNLGPGKYTQISNPNAKIEPFEVSTSTLMQFGSITQQNLGSMVNLFGAADQQMAAGAGQGMSATPQGVEAQTELVDITTNNYQKAIEAFFSHYCSYALTVYFQEMRAVKKVTPTAEARIKLLKAGLPTESINDDGTIDIDFENLATEYWVRCVPGSLTELEDEKQLRILNQLFIPLSQAMPAMAASNNPEMLAHAAKAMQYIISKQLELSGSSSAKDLGLILQTGDIEAVNERDAKIAELETNMGAIGAAYEAEQDMNAAAIAQLQEQVSLLVENNSMLLQKLGVSTEQPSSSSAEDAGGASAPAGQPPTVMPASA